ncbi:MAG: hypothetical protein AMXMBFR83_07190 [Phycisphaerae bacterium]
MRKRPLEILLVEEDAELADLIGRFLTEGLGASATHAGSAADAVREELTTRHDVVLVSRTLPDGDSLDLIRAIRRHNDCPILLMGHTPTAEEVIEAMRLGVVDVLNKPFELEHLADVVKNIGERRRLQRRERSRQRRLRKLVARIICERRDLARRIDLICRDFVLAHRRLAEKVTQSGVLSQIRE